MNAGRTSFAKENRKKIISTIIKEQKITRPQIVQSANISTSNVRTIIEQYLQYDVIKEVGIEVSSGGRKAKLLGMNTSRNYILILNNMWEKTGYLIYDAEGNMVENDYIHVHRFDEEAIFKLIEEMIRKYHHIIAIGICAYGVVKGNMYLTGTTAKNWEEVYLGRNIQSHFPVTVYMINNLRAAAYGASYLYDHEFEEHKRENKNLVFLHLSHMGTGLGILINGQLHEGFKNIAGETGFMPMLDTYADDLFVNQSLSKEQISELTGRYTSIINYVLNPELIVLSSEYHQADMLNDTIHQMEIISPPGFCPKLIVADDYELMTTLGAYYYTRNKVIEDELWFR